MKLFGRAGTALFDAWSIAHLAAGILIGFNCNTSWIPLRLGQAALVALLFGYAWEVVEGFYLEPRGAVRKPETPWNRWLADPLMVTLGGILGWLVVANLE